MCLMSRMHVLNKYLTVKPSAELIICFFYLTQNLPFISLLLSPAIITHVSWMRQYICKIGSLASSFLLFHLHHALIVAHKKILNITCDL
jgi:hypothetical protein